MYQYKSFITESKMSFQIELNVKIDFKTNVSSRMFFRGPIKGGNFFKASE